jgi:GTP-binding protein
MNKIFASKFIKGVVGEDEILEKKAVYIAFIGRSNVGKSSLINSLCERKELAKVGKKPGKTTEINIFSINEKDMFFVDLPGYGYAKGGKQAIENIRNLILFYFTQRNHKPNLTVLIIDSKVGVTPYDKEMIDILVTQKLPYVIVASKIDKINQSVLSKSMREIKIAAGTEDIIPYSAFTKKGKDALLDRIFSILIK